MLTPQHGQIKSGLFSACGGDFFQTGVAELRHNAAEHAAVGVSLTQEEFLHSQV
jgi:hypothetical protein